MIHQTTPERQSDDIPTTRNIEKADLNHTVDQMLSCFALIMQ
jgi:hypothetical protein